MHHEMNKRSKVMITNPSSRRPLCLGCVERMFCVCMCTVAGWVRRGIKTRMYCIRRPEVGVREVKRREDGINGGGRKGFFGTMKGLHIEGVTCYTHCKVLWGKFVILGYTKEKKKLHLTQLGRWQDIVSTFFGQTLIHWLNLKNVLVVKHVGWGKVAVLLLSSVTVCINM